ncbi:MAG: hypothetical protein JSW50_12305 [Candidatus Latescibacterota bacterium]|nr:MAG: hypothetical protein JSW50_12305 [Candidatus Latescibacterota bacterium]
MPTLWIRDDDCLWSALPLSDRPIEIDHPFPIERSAEELVDTQIDGVVLFPVDNSSPVTTWALLWGPDRDVRINGLSSFTVGIRVMDDRDEIRIGTGGEVYFTTETLPVVETFEGSTHDIFCPRCRKQIEPGQSVVRCPGPACGLMYHYNADKALNCYEYADNCVCGHPSTLDAGYRWVPDEVSG